jgi:hypothetical protein
MIGVGGFRYIMFMFMFETMLEGLLKGWRKAKPTFTLETNIDDNQWENLKMMTIDWIKFYNVVEVNLSCFLRCC